MSILAWIEDQRTAQLLDAPKYTHKDSTPISRSQGLWTRCDNCGVILYIKHLKENIRVCFGCGYHLHMESSERISSLIDPGTWRPLDEILSPVDPLQFNDQKPYVERLRDAQKKTGLQDAIQTGTGLLHGIPIALGVMDFHFMGGSMGSVVGEKITRLIEYATEEGYTLVLVCASGGARMQEGIFSLMQMAKISSALQVYQSCANLLYISVITSPTTGGVTASFAMLGDLVFAEPKALIGFAGRRVIEQTLQEELPEDFQTAEYLLHHGLLDLIVPRCFLKAALSEIIYLYKNAPNKPSGFIPYGVARNLSFLEIEAILRSLKESTISSQPGNKGSNQVIGDGDSDKAVSSTKKFNDDTVQTSADSIYTSLISKNVVLKDKNKEALSVVPSIQKNTTLEKSRTNYSQANSATRATELLFSSLANHDPEYKDNREINLKTFYSKSRASFKALFNYLQKGGSNTSEQPLGKEQNRPFSNNRKTDWLSAIELATTQKIPWMWGHGQQKDLRVASVAPEVSPSFCAEDTGDYKSPQPGTDLAPPLVLYKG